MQFTVYRNTDRARAKAAPYLLDVQSALIDEMRTCVVVPLIAPARARVAVSRLMPVLQVDGDPWVMDTTLLAGVSRTLLGRPVADLSHERAAILAALDLLFSGI